MWLQRRLENPLIFSHLESSSMWRKRKTTEVGVGRDVAPNSAQLALCTPESPVAEPGHFSCSDPFFTIWTRETKTNRNQNTPTSSALTLTKQFFNEVFWKAVPSSVRRLWRIQPVARSHLSLPLPLAMTLPVSAPEDKAPLPTVSALESQQTKLLGWHVCHTQNHTFQIREEAEIAYF